MAKKKSSKFLPGAFQTDVNEKFLSATMDQLISEPKLKTINGYVGRIFAPTYKNNDYYIQESTKARQDSQLEPSVVAKDDSQNIQFFGSYLDVLDKIRYYGGFTDKQDRLFDNEFYSFDPLVDLDKLVNFGQYYWLPNGPDAVEVNTLGVESQKDFQVTRDPINVRYQFQSAGAITPTLTLARGGTYTFETNQTGIPFWIQSEPGVDGKINASPNLSSRDVEGVENNGTDDGILTFRVPQYTAQDRFTLMPTVDTVQYATGLKFTDVHNHLLSELISNFDGFDGQYSQLDGKKIIFVNQDQFEGGEEVWTTTGEFDNINIFYDRGTVVPSNERHGVYQIQLLNTTGPLPKPFEDEDAPYDEGFNLEDGSGFANTLVSESSVSVIDDYLINLVFVRQIELNEKVFVRAGFTNSGKFFYKDYNGLLYQQPNITANKDILYYQDGSNSNIYGEIRLVDPTGWNINVNTDILGKLRYTSPNGVVFTNGLKISFGTDVVPTTYRNKTYYVEGVGFGIKLVNTEFLVNPELYNVELIENYPDQTFPEYVTINRGSLDINAWSRNNRWFHSEVLQKTAEYNNTTLILDQDVRARRPIVEFIPDLQLFNSGKIGKQPVDIIDFVTSRPYGNSSVKSISSFSSAGNTLVLGASVADLTLGQTVTATNIPTGTYVTRIFTGNNSVQLSSANVGSVSGSAVFECVESKIVSSSDAFWGGIKLVETSGANIGQLTEQGRDGIRVIFAAADDEIVTPNDIHILSCIDVDGTGAGGYQIHLEQADDGETIKFDSVCVTGNIRTTSGQVRSYGKQYHFNGINWVESQQKTTLIQEPLFDVFDDADFTKAISFGDTSKYIQSTFAGTKIFGYKRGTGSDDSILGFPLSYRNFISQGDIEFQDYFETDKFTYIDQSITVPTPYDRYENINISNGFIHKNINALTNIPLNMWRTVAEYSKQYQTIRFNYTGTTRSFELDVDTEQENLIPYIKVFVNNKQIIRDFWTISGRIITISNNYSLENGDKVDIQFYSKSSSSLGSYQVPSNLDLNAQNKDFEDLTLGQMRNHLTVNGQNSTKVTGDILGVSNLRDIDILSHGGNILQHSSPVPYSIIFLLAQNSNFVEGLRLAQQEYSKFKNKFLELSLSLSGIDPTDPIASVDLILSTMNDVKNSSFPWYYSDMVPYGSLKNKISYTIFDPFQREYEITTIFNPNELGNTAVLVYLNGTQLLKDRDYSFNSNRPTITILSSVTLEIDDLLEIIEYSNTDGNYIPETPTKLGLYPKFTPGKFLDDSYLSPIYVIKGHDGSLTPSFDDYRDNFLLELEKRIYNNIKVTYNSNLFDIYDVIPGKFRESDYTLDEWNRLLYRSFLTWVGVNRVDYTTNSTFLSNDPFTWNYNKNIDRIDGQPLQGSWRACFRYFYDCETPNRTPWEMLGLSEEPLWWKDRYGPAPYTGGNYLLWEDLQAGNIWNPDTETYSTDSRFVRPGLLNIIPVDENGFLLSPAAILTKGFNSIRMNSSWAIGHIGPAENAWRRSSDYPFAVNLAQALAKPARYFGSLIDTKNYAFNSFLNQYLITQTPLLRDSGVIAKNNHIRQSGNYIVNNANYLLNDITFNGDSVTFTGIVAPYVETTITARASGYLNWIAERLINLGIDPKSQINLLKNYQVNLAYKVGGFTDKKYLQVLAEQASPTSTNDSVLLPAENFDVYLNENPVPVQRITYSAVILEKSTGGYTVRGYDLNTPYFTIIPSVVNSNSSKITILNKTATVFFDYEKYKINVPYGYEFKTIQQVADFLISYERYLRGQGFVFNDIDEELAEIRNFQLSIKEFLMWAQQGWKPGSLLVLSPTRNVINVITSGSIVGKIFDNSQSSRIVDQNFKIVKNNNYNVLRSPTNFKVTLTNQQTIGFVELNLVQFEHTLIFDNETVFNDIIYKPEQGSRQYRLKLVGQITDEWDGSLSPPGFIYNNDNIPEWQSGRDYLKGDLVEFKDQYYVSLDKILAKETFDPKNWKNIPVSSIKTGLLRNFATNAKLGEQYYENYGQFLTDSTQVVDRDHALIGFSARNFLTDLAINNTTQIELYKGYIKTKGTKNSVSALLKAQFNNINSDITFNEEWAVRVGEFGAIDINKYIEILLDEEAFSVNPSTATFNSNVNYYNTDKTVFGNLEIYRSEGTYNGHIALNRANVVAQGTSYINDVVTCGFPSLDEIDMTIFDIKNYQNLNDEIAKIGSGYTIWVAKDFTQDWNVYRVTETDNSVTMISNALDGYIKITTSDPHKFTEDKVFAIKGFNSQFDGFYQVDTIKDSYNFTVAFSGDLEGFTSVEDEGILFSLDSLRFPFPEALRLYNPPHGWLEGERAWVDTYLPDGNDPYIPGKWAIYEKAFPWTLKQTLDPTTVLANVGYGSRLRLGERANIALIGSPGNNRVTTFVKVSSTDTLTQANVLFPTLANASSFGGAVEITGNKIFIGAPASDSNKGHVEIYTFTANTTAGTITYTHDQTLVAPNAGGKFGFSIGSNFGSNVTSSFGFTPLDNNVNDWLYIGAPDLGRVYVYGANVANSRQYELTDIIQGNLNSGFGEEVHPSFDGAQVVINARKDDNNYGAVWVYDRSIEAFKSTGGNLIIANRPLRSINRVTIDNVYVDPSQYIANVGNAHVLFANTISGGSIVRIETNEFTKMQKIVASNNTLGTISTTQEDIEFGTSSTICSYGCAIYIGAPYYDEGDIKEVTNSGAAYKFHHQARLYGRSTTFKDNANVAIPTDVPVTSPAGTPSNVSIKLNDFEVFFRSNTAGFANLYTISDDINAANIVGIRSEVSSTGYLELFSDSTVLKQRLGITPGKSPTQGPVLDLMGLDVFVQMQIIVNPYGNKGEKFGNCVVLTPSAGLLAISSERGTTKSYVSFDSNDTIFDATTTQFTDSIPTAGAVSIFELYDDPRQELELPGRYAFNMQLDPGDLNTGDAFGTIIDIAEGYILTSAINDDDLAADSGRVYLFNSDGRRGWELTRVWEPRVDPESVTRMYLYDTRTNTILDNIEHIDPVKGKILGLAEQEISYKTGYDPAVYNRGNNPNVTINTDLYWNNTQLDKVWWNLDKIRYIDYEQGSLKYRSLNWGKLFPGSEVEICEWTESSVLPSQYQESGLNGQPLYPDDSAYVETMTVDKTTGVIGNRYYYWVKNKTELSVTAKNTARRLPTQTIADYIENPKAQGIAYSAVLRSDAIDLYNISEYLSGTDTALHIDSDKIKNTNIIHSEYELIQTPPVGNISELSTSVAWEPNTDYIPGQIITYRNIGYKVDEQFTSGTDFVATNLSPYPSVKILALPNKIINKMIDSLSGEDSSGNAVPDTTLLTNHIILSANATANANTSVGTVNLTFGGTIVANTITTTNNSDRISTVSSIEGIEIGMTVTGNNIPTGTRVINLYPSRTAQAYGISIRPRQTMFVNRANALKQTVDYVNSVLIRYQITGLFDTTGLSTEEEKPSINTGIWDLEVSSVEQRDYIYTDDKSTGYSVLVDNDINYEGKWTIYSWNALTKVWAIKTTASRSYIQEYKTNLYWSYVDWYSVGYSSATKPNYVAEDTVSALKIAYAPGDIIKINNRGDGKFRLVLVNSNLTFEDIGVEDGTIQLDSSIYTKNPDQSKKEIRYILTALKNDIFTSILGNEFNNLFFVLVNYLLTEQPYVDWIFKTSFITIIHQLRTLSQVPNYVKDNQNYYQQYIEEVKPYKTQIREYLIDYTGKDIYEHAITDFDVPAYLDTETNIFRSPSGESPYTVNDGLLWANDTIYNQWYTNRGYEIDSIIIANPGIDYTDEPIIEIYSNDASGSGAEATATINFDTGQVTNITVTNPGSGYVSVPTIRINGNGRNATAYAVLKNSKVRGLKTYLKFDRIQYTANVTMWSPNTTIWAGNLVSYSNIGYVAGNTFTTGSTFTLDNLTRANISTISNANDRIMAWYAPSIGMPSKDLSQLLKGIDYPGVQVQGLSYTLTPEAVTGYVELNSAINLYGITDATLGQATRGSYLTQDISGANVSLSIVNSQGYLWLGNTITANVGDYITYPVSGSNVIVLANVTNSANVLVRYINSSPFNLANVALGNVYLNGVDVLRVNAYPFSSNITNVAVQYNTTFGFVLNNSDVGNIKINEVYQTGGNIYPVNYIKFDGRLDGNISSTYLDSNLGIRSEDIIVGGGAYVDTYSSHAPEEFVPGKIFDTLDMKVYTLISGNTVSLGYRILVESTAFDELQSNGRPFFGNIGDSRKYLRISDTSTTQLTQPLYYSDQEIIVADGTKLPTPSREAGVPGVIFVNNEKITYYRNNAAEVLPWGANILYLVSSPISYGNTSTLSGNISANVGGYITQISSNANARILANVVSSGNVWYEYVNGNVFTTGSGNLLLNGTDTNVYPSTATVGYYVTTQSTQTATFPTGNVRPILYINSLGQIRRGVGSTGTPNVHPVGTKVVDASNQQAIPGIVKGSMITGRSGNVEIVIDDTAADSYTANVIAGNVSFGNLTLVNFTTTANSNVIISTNNFSNLANLSVGMKIYSANIAAGYANVTAIRNRFAVTQQPPYLLRLSGNITANVGDYLYQTSTGSNLIVQSATSSGNLQVVLANTAISTGTANVIFGFVGGGGNITVSGVTRTANSNVLRTTASSSNVGSILGNMVVYSLGIQGNVSTINTIEGQISSNVISVVYANSSIGATTFAISNITIRLNGNITANVGDWITQDSTGANLQVMANASANVNVTVASTNINLLRLNANSSPWLGNIRVNGSNVNLYPISRTISATGNEYIKLNNTGANLLVYPIGISQYGNGWIQGTAGWRGVGTEYGNVIGVNGTTRGNVYLPPNIQLYQDTVFYDQGLGQPADGNGFESTLTVPVLFLKEQSGGYDASSGFNEESLTFARILISNAATASGTVSTMSFDGGNITLANVITTLGSQTLQTFSNIAGITANMTVSGTGIVANTTVTGVLTELNIYGTEDLIDTFIGE